MQLWGWAVVCLHVEDQNGHSLVTLPEQLVTLPLFNGSAQLPLLQGARLGYLVTQMQTKAPTQS